MGREDYHLHLFRIGRERYGVPDPVYDDGRFDPGRFDLEEAEARMGRLRPRRFSKE